jgi:nucleotide-binding universal stress UspA family protein
MKNIMIATDGSPSATEALDFAIELARETGGTLHAVAVRPLAFRGRGGPVPPVAQIEEFGGAEEIAAAAAEKARAAGVPAEAHAPHGPELDMIRAAATSVHADLLVVGSRGYGPLTGSLMGSISHGLVKQSPVPVTVVRAHAVREPVNA